MCATWLVVIAQKLQVGRHPLSCRDVGLRRNACRLCDQMNTQLILTSLGVISTIIVTVATWLFATGRYAGANEQKAIQLAREFDAYKTEMSRRFEKAGEQTSKAMTYIQGLESRFTREFASRDLVDERFADNRREHERFLAELDRLKNR